MITEKGPKGNRWNKYQARKRVRVGQHSRRHEQVHRLIVRSNLRYINDCRIKYFDAATSIRPHVFRHGDRSSGGRKRGGRKGKMTDLTREDSEDGDDDKEKNRQAGERLGPVVVTGSGWDARNIRRVTEVNKGRLEGRSAT